MSSALVRPGDITDAVDADDLLNTLLATNLETINDKKKIRIQKEWAGRERMRLKDDYKQKALAAYEKMWNACGSGSIGHDWVRQDAGNVSVDVCQVCQYHVGQPYNNGDAPIRRANEMNSDLVSALADRLIELDLEAGILVYPGLEDTPDKIISGQIQDSPAPKQPIIIRRRHR